MTEKMRVLALVVSAVFLTACGGPEDDTRQDAGSVATNGEAIACETSYTQIWRNDEYEVKTTTYHAVLEFVPGDSAPEVHALLCDFEQFGNPLECGVGGTCTGQVAPRATCQANALAYIVDGTLRVDCGHKLVNYDGAVSGSRWRTARITVR